MFAPVLFTVVYVGRYPLIQLTNDIGNADELLRVVLDMPPHIFTSEVENEDDDTFPDGVRPW